MAAANTLGTSGRESRNHKGRRVAAGLLTQVSPREKYAMFSRIVTGAALLSACGVAAFAIASSPAPAFVGAEEEAQVVSGMITSVTLEDSTFSLAMGEEESMTFTYGEETVFTIDGEQTTAADALVEGFDATVTHVETVASEVNVSTPEPESR